MESKFCIFVVDDDSVMQTLLGSILQKDYEVEIFSSSEDCLTRLADKTPDMFLLDVGLPGINGYALCRQIKDEYATRHVPVTFISGHDSEEDRLTGYDSGGDDFVVKPFNVDEILQKVKVAQRLLSEKDGIRQQASESEMLASLVLANMDEYAVVIQFIRTLTECTQALEIAEAMLKCLRGLQLQGVVQIRINGGELTLSPEGQDRPLEISVMSNVLNMGRIFEFKKRAIYNFERISVMVNNVPVEDPELCGRIRDHLAIALEVADSRLSAIQTSDANLRKQEGIFKVLERIRAIIHTLDENQKHTQIMSSEIIYKLQEDSARAFISLCLTESQEDMMDQLIKDRLGELVALFDRADETHAMLSELGQQLEGLSA